MKALVERVFSIFGPPETLHSDQGPEFGNKVVKQNCRTSLVTRKLKGRPIVRKATLCRSVCIWPYMSCFRCTAILDRIIGLKSYCSYTTVVYCPAQAELENLSANRNHKSRAVCRGNPSF